MASLQGGRIPEAESRLRRLLASDPGHEEGRFALGILLGRTGRWEESHQHLAKVVTASPSRDEALFWLALAKKHLGFPQEAIALCERALAINPRNPTLLNELGLCQLTLNQPSAAEKSFSLAIRSDPLKGVYHFNYGLALVRLDRIYKAKEAFEEAIRIEPSRIESYLELARILEILDMRTEVVDVLGKGLGIHPAEFQLLTAMAAAQAYLGNRAQAEDIYKKSMAAHPVSGNAFGLWLQQEGRFVESVECFLTSIKAMPVQGVAYYGLAEAKVFDIDGEPWAIRAESWLDSPELDLKGKTYLCYALARASERRGDHERTMRFFHLANASAYALYNEGRPYNRQDLEALSERTIANYSEASVREVAKGASPSQCPIFIVGMIRSGTTLLDQVISSHPEVKSAGEPVFWMRESDRIRRLRDQELSADQIQDIAQRYLAVLEAVAGTSPRITDKMPLNYAHLGLIHRIFPDAKIIHLRRHPLDTCFSIYTTFLGQGPTFGYNASNIVFNYRLYLKLMSHWRQVLPESQFLEVDYESLIENREVVARQIIEFCELDWSDDCLHHERNESSIRTPSKWQARQPIYSSSIHRWAPYEAWLGELLELRNGT